MNSAVNCAPVASTPRIISANPVNIIVACGHRLHPVECAVLSNSTELYNKC